MKTAILILSITLLSCNENKNQIISKNYTLLDKKLPPCICEYWYNNGIGNSVSFQDSCNKYNVFDTLKSNQNK